MPDDSDEQFWDDFSRDLWVLLKKSEDFEAVESENLIINNTAEIPNSRENCLTFTRCAEIGQQQFAVSDVENAHLQDCRFCARRIEKFGELPKTVIQEAIEEKPAKKSWWSNFFSAISEAATFDWLSGKLVAASLAVVAIFGIAIIIFQLLSNQRYEQIAVISDSNTNSPTPRIAELPTNENLESPSNIRLPANEERVYSTISPKKTAEIPPKEIDKEKRSSEDLAVELAFLSKNEREAVRQSVQVGRIQISEDLAQLQQDTTRRGNEDFPIKQILPKNEATLESQPVLRWQNAENSEYRITVFDQALNKVAESEVLRQNSWQIDKKLAAGFYFWEVLARKKDAAEFKPASKQAFFKIVGDAEKSRIEKAKRATKSNLISAILYARAGLFAEAERDLNAELKKNPKSVKAQKMLAQVREWKMK